MSTVEQTAREKELKGLCESQQQELQEVREALHQRATDECDTQTRAERPPDVDPATGRAEPPPVTTATPGTALSEAGKHLAAIDNLIQSLQLATTTYRRGPLDWDDVATLRLVREQLGRVANGYAAAEAAIATRRAARQVATEVRQFRATDSPVR